MRCCGEGGATAGDGDDARGASTVRCGVRRANDETCNKCHHVRQIALPYASRTTPIDSCQLHGPTLVMVMATVPLAVARMVMRNSFGWALENGPQIAGLAMGIRMVQRVLHANSATNTACRAGTRDGEDGEG